MLWGVRLLKSANNGISLYHLPGTYPLPEAQVDRFMLKAKITYPRKEEERDIVRMNLSGAGMPQPNKVITPEDIVKARKVVEDVW